LHDIRLKKVTATWVFMVPASVVWYKYVFLIVASIVVASVVLEAFTHTHETDVNTFELKTVIGTDYLSSSD